ncbi:hypothetical protein [Nocardioides aequoreus]|uniref:hypothetical protein n=1 Tax=Nocardioides aequoreus TaxID=397278 RepID=UPI00068F05A3|nr:hypothetical protein [Nocardioides aequoreus]
MVEWLRGLSVSELVWLTLLVLLVLLVVSGLLTRALVRRGLRTPWVIRRINRVRERAIDVVKRPITVAVLDEVADVIATGHYTKNISAALVENHDELIELVREKVRDDPASRVVNRLPGYDAIVGQVTETTLRVLIEMLGDPRMDELVSDLLRNNLQQIKRAVREREHEEVRLDEPDPAPIHLSHLAPDRRR